MDMGIKYVNMTVTDKTVYCEMVENVCKGKDEGEEAWLRRLYKGKDEKDDQILLWNE